MFQSTNQLNIREASCIALVPEWSECECTWDCECPCNPPAWNMIIPSNNPQSIYIYILVSTIPQLTIVYHWYPLIILLLPRFSWLPLFFALLDQHEKIPWDLHFESIFMVKTRRSPLCQVTAARANSWPPARDHLSISQRSGNHMAVYR